MRVFVPLLGGFSPLKIPGLLAFWDAAAALNAVGPDAAAADGQTVRRLPDLSGRGNHLDQTVGVSQPVMSSLWRNGRAGLVFDGANDFLTNPGTLLPVSDGATYTVASVFTCTGGNSFKGVWAQGHTATASGASAGAALYSPLNTLGHYAGHEPTGVDTIIKAGDTGAAVRTFRLTSTQLLYNCAGVATTPVARSSTNPANAPEFRLGQWTNDSLSLAMTFGVLGIWNRALTNAEVSRLESYWKTVYGL